MIVGSNNRAAVSAFHCISKYFMTMFLNIHKTNSTIILFSRPTSTNVAHQTLAIVKSNAAKQDDTPRHNSPLSDKEHDPKHVDRPARLSKAWHNWSLLLGITGFARLCKQ